jgi:hypothetical protein
VPPARRVAPLLPALLAGAGALLAAAATVGTAAPAAAATPCVGVVVDGRLAGGTLRTACAEGDPRDGLAALTTAGISYAFVPRQPGQVCQLDGRPACSDTGTDTYWSYWWRAKGSDRWVYATTGAGTHDPEPGDTEAWVWQDGGRVDPPDISFRRICPQAAVAATPTPKPSATRTRTTTAPSSTSTEPASGSGSRPAESSVPSAATSAPAEPSSPAPTTTSAAAAASSPPPSQAAPGPRLGSRPDGGSGLPPWTGIAVAAVLAGGLGGAALLRARRGSP